MVLQALGYICDELDPDLIDSQMVNQILSAIVDGLRADRSDDIRLAAITALNNSLSYAAANFNVDVERDAIMTKICETTQCADVKVRETAFECLAKVADFYYDKLSRYVDAVFQITTAAIR
jgi:importin subunit beta-1